MNNLIINDYHLREKEIDIHIRRSTGLSHLSINRCDFEEWLKETGKLDTHFSETLPLDIFWSALYSKQMIKKDLSEYITVKGLNGDPFKDTFAALQNICNRTKTDVLLKQ